MKETALHRLLSDAFDGGERTCRELRLSDEDVRALALRHPESLRPLGEQWYLVTLKSPV